jgi:hypothetical protein
MKYLKYFESSENIDSICKKYSIENYNINPDGTVDVDGDVDLSDMGLDKLPLKFGYVSGYFYCTWNYLTSLEGSPKEVGETFDCADNGLTSLEGAPRKVGRGFFCNDNQLTSLRGCPEEVGGNFNCSTNKITSLEGDPMKVGGGFSCQNNKLTSLIGSPEIVVNSFWCNDNQLKSLMGAPEEIGGDFRCHNNPTLPKEILNNYKYIKKIVKYQNDYNIWRRDDTLDAYRFSDMMKEILEEEK